MMEAIFAVTPSETIKCDANSSERGHMLNAVAEPNLSTTSEVRILGLEVWRTEQQQLFERKVSWASIGAAS